MAKFRANANKKGGPRILALLGAVSLFYCAPHKVRETVAVPDSAPASFSQRGEAPAVDRWWLIFEDPQLNELMEEALNNNLDLAAAWARLNQFRALAVQAGSQKWPELSLGGNASRGRSFLSGEGRTSNLFDLSLSASYEVDLWRRIASTGNAAELEALGGEEDVSLFAFTLSSTVARTWFGLLAEQEQLALLNRQLEVSQKFLDIIEVRFQNSRATAVDVFQQREQLASLRAQIPQVKANFAVLAHQLAVLLGKAPNALPLPELHPMPRLPPLPQTGVPSDLIQTRPDLRKARLQVMAADYRIAAAIADRFPSLRLTGSAGYQAGELSDLFDDWIWNLAAGIVGPIFDANRRKSEVSRTRSVLEEQLANYEQTFLTAVQEVEDALAREHYQHELVDKLKTQLKYAEAALESGQERYLRGVGNFLTVLTEIQAVQRVERQQIDAKRALLGHRVSLLLALGGDWTRDLKPNMN